MALMKGVYVDTEGKEHIIDLKLNADGKLEISGLQVDTLEMGSLQIASGSDASELQITNGAANVTLATGLNPTDDIVSVQGPTNGDQNRKVIGSTGVGLSLSGGSIACKYVVLTALPGNTAPIWVGFINVNATAGAQTGIPLNPNPDTSKAGDSCVIETDNLNKVYINGTAADGVSYAYVV